MEVMRLVLKFKVMEWVRFGWFYKFFSGFIVKLVLFSIGKNLKVGNMVLIRLVIIGISVSIMI